MFFFSVWHILSTIQIWNCTYYNTKGKWEEKHSFCTKKLGKRGLVLFFFFLVLFVLSFFFKVIFRQSGTRARGWQEETETIYKEPECKGMHISTNFVDFESLKYNCSLEQWNVKWLTKLNRNFIYIPILCVIKKEVCWMTLRNIQLNFDFWTCKDRLEGQ